MGWKKSSDTTKLGLLQSHPGDNYGSVITLREKSQPKHEKPAKPSFWGLFRYSNQLDIILMVVGTIFAVLSGTTLPILGFYFGGMTDVFIKEAVHGLAPDFVFNSRFINTIKNSTPISINETEHIQTSPSEDGKHLVFSLFHTVIKKYLVNLSHNDTTEDLPLTVSEFRNNLDTYLIIYILIGTFMMLCSFIQTLCWEYSSEHRVCNLRRIYFSQIIRQDMSWYDTNENGNLPNKLSDDLERIREGTGYKCAMIVQYISTFISGVFIGLLVNPTLTLSILCVGPFLVGLNAYCAAIAARNLAQEQKRYAIAGKVVEESLTNIRTVNAFCGHAVEAKRYYDGLEEGRKIAMQTFNAYSVCYAITFFLMYSAYALGFWYGSQMVQSGSSTPGNIFTVFFTVIIGAFSVGNALPFVNVVSGSIGVAASVHHVISRKVVIDPYSKTGRKPTHVSGCIEFRKVTFAYPSRPTIAVLNGLNLDIEPGKTTAIVGSSGGGKSTIISLILRYYDTNDGQVCIDGVPVTELNLKWLRDQIGLVSQEPVLFGVSIADNIRYGRDNVSFAELVEAAKQANAHEFVMKLPKGYDTLVGDTGSQLSGGQKQRIAIARALVRNPKILLLDEATSALDSKSEGIVQATLTKVMKGRTTVIIAHRLSTIKDADVIYVMQNGQVFESGQHDELMERKSLYYNLVQAQKSAKDDTQKTTKSSLRKTSAEASDSSSTAADHSSGSSEEYEDQKSHDDVGYLNNKKDLSAKGEIDLTKTSSKKNQKHYHYQADEFSLEEKNRIPFTKPENIEQEYTLWELIRLQVLDWPWWIMAFLGSICVGIIMPLFGLYYGEIFSVFTLQGSLLQNATTFWTYMLIGLAIFSAVSYAVQVKGITHGCEKMIVRVRALAFENTLKQPVGWFDLETSAPGIIGNRLARNGPIVKSAAGLRAAQLLVSIVTISCAFLISVIYGWKLVLVLGVFVPLVMYASYKQQVLLRRNQVRDTKLMDDAGRVAAEAVRNIRTVQALGREKLFVEIYAGHLELPYKESKKQALLYALLYAATQGISYYMYALSFRAGGILVEIGEMNAKGVYTVFFALSLCAACVGMAFSYLQDYSKSRTSLRLLNFLMTRKSEIDASSPVGVTPEVTGNVKFQDVHFCYPARPDVKILKGLTFSIKAGETVALVGESGCGKSTVISLLERFYDPISGSILVDNFDIRACNIAHLRSKMGIVTQEPILFDTTIRDNIAYGLVGIQEEVTFEEIQKAAKLANIHDFILSLPNRYDTMVGERGVQLSGGQKQRVAIARALIRDPKILLLDEATSALDTENEKMVQAALEKAKKGRTCIIVAHRLSTIRDADKICVVSHGKIAEEGTHEELIQLQGLYYQLTQRQFL